MSQAHTLTLNDIEFKIDNLYGSKTVGIISYNADYKDIIVPEELDGVKVASILDGAFKDKGLTGVVMPSSVVYISYEAFKGNLFTSITFPQPRVSISYHAFDHGVVKAVGTPPPKCLSFADDNLNIFYSSELHNEISVDNIDTPEGLHRVANAYLKLSERIDENRANYNVDIEFSQLDYTIYVITEDGLSDEAFFERFMGDPELELKAVQFVKNIENWYGIHDAGIWQDEQTPLGEYAAYVLAKHDQKYIELYTQFLAITNLDTEGDRSEQIEELIAKYGLCKEILSLIALRFGKALGQDGLDHAPKHQQAIFELFNKSPEMKSFFFREIANLIGDDEFYLEELFNFAEELIEGEQENWLESLMD